MEEVAEFSITSDLTEKEAGEVIIIKNKERYRKCKRINLVGLQKTEDPIFILRQISVK